MQPLPPDYVQRRRAAVQRSRLVRQYAHSALRRAVKAGRVIRRPCEVCGALPVEGHHDDYEKPLEVRWLCVYNHRLLHGRAK